MMLSGSSDGPHPHIYHHSVRHVPGWPRGLEMGEISERITRQCALALPLLGRVPVVPGCLGDTIFGATASGVTSFVS